MGDLKQGSLDMPKSQQKTQNNPQVRNNDDKTLIDTDNI